MPDLHTSSEILSPWDAHNRRLADHVAPADWENPRPADRYNLVVVGGGTAGLVTAIVAAGLGAKVALVERHLLGGDCLNTGCVPSKALIRAARAAAAVRDAGRFGIGAGEPSVDFPAVMERMRSLRADIAVHDSAAKFRDAGVDVFLGEGRFTDRKTLAVGGAALSFRKAVIATGARAMVPPIPGLAEAGYLTNESVFSLTELPARLAVIGAGPIGCELAQTFARFGSHVVLIELADRVLPREDPAASAIVAAALRADGVELRLGVSLSAVRRDGAARRLSLSDGGDEVTTDALLLAIGRAPNVEGIGLEDAGVRFDRKGVTVDDQLRTANPDIYAAGDVALKYQFTHAADFAARLIIRNALFKGRQRMSALLIPWATYTDPEVAHVGITPTEAEAQGVRIDTFTQELTGVDRAVLDGETQGFARVHVAAGSDRILGATIVASHAGELISEVTVAMRAGLGLGALASVIHPYPTQADALRKLGDAYNRTRFTPLVASAMKRWLRWTR